jgi:hypothetical protein
MPLSEGEQRRLDEIEHALKTEDPKFAANITIDRLRRHGAIVAVGLFVLGMIALVVGLVTTDALLILGIVITVAGALSMAAGVAMYLVPRFRR